MNIATLSSNRRTVAFAGDQMDELRSRLVGQLLTADSADYDEEIGRAHV